MISVRAELIATRDRIEGQYTPTDYRAALYAAQTEPAGSPSYIYVDGFVPIAGDDGDYLVVDVRGGDLHGSVTVSMRERSSSGPL